MTRVASLWVIVLACFDASVGLGQRLSAQSGELEPDSTTTTLPRGYVGADAELLFESLAAPGGRLLVPATDHGTSIWRLSAMRDRLYLFRIVVPDSSWSSASSLYRLNYDSTQGLLAVRVQLFNDGLTILRRWRKLGSSTLTNQIYGNQQVREVDADFRYELNTRDQLGPSRSFRGEFRSQLSDTSARALRRNLRLFVALAVRAGDTTELRQYQGPLQPDPSRPGGAVTAIGRTIHVTSGYLAYWLVDNRSGIVVAKLRVPPSCDPADDGNADDVCEVRAGAGASLAAPGLCADGYVFRGRVDENAGGALVVRATTPRGMRTEGFPVTLTFVLDCSGHPVPSSFTVRGGVDPRLAQAAVEAMLREPFTPAKVRGKPARVELSRSVVFDR